MSAATRSIQTEVLVIGGGATGVGTAWDAALRGFDVVLVERSDLVEGTSGRFHGLLHSGGRYVVKDPRGGQGVRRRERAAAPADAGLHRGHRRAVRDDARRRSRLRRPLPRGLPRGLAPGRGARGRRGAAPRAAAEPRHPARVRRGGRLDRRVEDRLVTRARRHRSRRARAHLSPRRGPAPRRRGRDRRARARRAQRRGVRHRGRASSSTPRGRGPRRSCTWRASRTWA